MKYSLLIEYYIVIFNNRFLCSENEGECLKCEMHIYCILHGEENSNETYFQGRQCASWPNKCAGTGVAICLFLQKYTCFTRSRISILVHIFTIM